MTNDLELENQKDLPAEEGEAEMSSDSVPQDAPAVEQEAEEPVLEEAAPVEASEDEAEEEEVVEAATEHLDTSEGIEIEAVEEEGQEEPETEVAEIEEPLDAAAESEDVSVELDAPEEVEPEEAPSEETEVSTDVSEDVIPEADVEVVAEEEDDRNWYVVHCYSGYENKVRHNLEQRIETMGMKDRIFDVVVPTEEEIEVKDGKRKTIERRVFPGYILVQMIMTEESWYVVRNTPGVTGFVGMGNEPTALRPEEVSQIIKRMEAEAPRIKVTYKIGQKVRIIDGPFNDFIGTVDEIDMERAKVRVMVSFFGRETPVELDFLQVEKA